MDILGRCDRSRLLTAVQEHEPALLPAETGPERAVGIYKPVVHRKGNEADRQENDKSTSHISSLPVNNKNCVIQAVLLLRHARSLRAGLPLKHARELRCGDQSDERNLIVWCQESQSALISVIFSFLLCLSEIPLLEKRER